MIRRQIDTTLAERRYELSAKQKQIEKDEKRMDELDRLFRKIYEDNVSGKLNDERFYKQIKFSPVLVRNLLL